MFKKSYNVIGMFFKECIWTVESAQTVLPKPNPVELENWRGRQNRVISS